MALHLGSSAGAEELHARAPPRGRGRRRRRTRGPVELEARLGRHRGEGEALLEAIDRMAQGVVLLDGRGRVLALSRAARAILDRRDGLALVDGEIRVGGGPGPQFRRLVADAARTGSGQGIGSGGVLTLAGPSGVGRHSLLVAPFRSTLESTLMGRQGPAAVVFLTEEGKGPRVDPVAIGRLYDLTPAEARLAAALAEGQTVKEVTRRLGVSSNTTRTHLQRIFDKTGVHRQAELTRLVLSSVAGLGAMPDEALQPGFAPRAPRIGPEGDAT